MDSTKEIAPTHKRAKKRLSQNFLIDRNVASKIVGTANISEGDRVIEVGPGRGMLTELIASLKVELTCIEIDPALAKSLKESFKGCSRVKVIEADALKFSFVDLKGKSEKRFKFISNLPYNISGPMLAKLIDEREVFSSLHLMFQKEVALRIVAGPGSKAYGSLSVLAQTYMDTRLEFDIPPHLFRPIPKVDSTLISLEVLDAPRVEVKNEEFYKRVVRCAFNQRRKTLANSLKALCPDKEKVLSALEASHIEPGRRGETLRLEEFSALAAKLEEECGS
ncbi:MAG: ribosomal RNA small subunit methyltransferase A [Proteobacteria bacterium]|nr:ribosomal RNA small subunit methyltransferase A [Pseudomonadota bacterium]